MPAITSFPISTQDFDVAAFADCQFSVPTTAALAGLVASAGNRALVLDTMRQWRFDSVTWWDEGKSPVGLLKDAVSLAQAAASVIVGSWDASSGAFPLTRPDGSGIRVGDTWAVVVSGTTGGEFFEAGDYLQAVKAGGGPVFAGSWARSATGQIKKWRDEAEDAAQQAALYDGPWLDSVATLLADTTLTYAAAQPSTVAAGDIIRTRAEGFSYKVAASGATDQHVTTAGGVRLYVLPGADGSLTLQAFGALGDNSADDRAAILTAIDAANAYFSTGLAGAGGARIVSRPGAQHRYSGRIRLRPGVTLDLGKGATSARLVATDATGGIEQVGGSGLRGELRTSNPAFTGPMLELDASKSTELSFGRNERSAWFDVGIRADRQSGSRGLVMRDAAGSGVAWVRGHAEIGECDFGVEMISEGVGYVNENWLDLSIYDAVESLRMTVASTGEVAANRITLTAQTGANGRSGIVLRCDGRRNVIDLTSWDWATARLNPSYDGTQVLLTAASGGNTLRGMVSRGLSASGFTKPAVIDLAPSIRRNWVLADDRRIHAPDFRSILPNGYFNFAMTGDQDDELAFASSRWTVTSGGATPPNAFTVPYLFQPDGRSCQFNACTEGTVTVDFGSTKFGTDFSTIGLLFSADTTKPQKVKIDFSTDGATWNTVLQAGYDGGEVPSILHRVDGGGLSRFRYIRLTVQCDVAKNVSVARMFLSCHGTSKTGGAWLPKYRPSAYERVNVITTFGGDGFYINDTQVVTTRRGAIPNAAAGTEVTTINAILTALRQHGLIST